MPANKNHLSNRISKRARDEIDGHEAVLGSHLDSDKVDVSSFVEYAQQLIIALRKAKFNPKKLQLWMRQLKTFNKGTNHRKLTSFMGEISKAVDDVTGKGLQEARFLNLIIRGEISEAYEEFEDMQRRRLLKELIRKKKKALDKIKESIAERNTSV